MKLSKIIILLINSLLVISCNEESIDLLETETTVVEGYLYAGSTVDSLKVTQSVSYGQEEAELITLDDLNITITDDNDQFELTPIGNGFYENLDFIIEPGKSYQLELERTGEIISAETYVPEKTEVDISTTEVQLEKIEAGIPPAGGFGNIPDPVEISWENEEGDYYYVLIKNIEDNPEYVNENIVQFGGQFTFITEPQVTDYYAINTRRDLTQFGTYQIIVYRVNPEYAALYESSGNSTLSLEEPPSNIVNGLGIFTGVSSDTLYLEVVKI